jgi:hypothetical protein
MVLSKMVAAESLQVMMSVVELPQKPIKIYLSKNKFYFYNWNYIAATRAATITPVTTATTINTVINYIYLKIFICVRAFRFIVILI